MIAGGGSTTHDMHSRVARGLGWVGASQIAGQLIRTAGAIAVARLLAPEAYGLAMLALVFASLVLVFSDLALGAALVQRKSLTEADRSTAFWTSVAAGVTFTAVGALLAGPIAYFYGEPAVKSLCVVYSLVFLITSIGSTQEALLVREMGFRQLELRTMGATVVGAAVGITVALKGLGSWAIVAQQLTEAAVS